MNITSRQLKAFLLTAKHLSFSRAAEQLFVSQSGMSVLVRELEEQLGFRLFERTTRNVKLTEFGMRFLPIADRSVLDLESAVAEIGRSAHAANGSLLIGAGPFVASSILLPAVAAYSAREPALRIRVADVAPDRLVDMSERGDFDVTLTFSEHATPATNRSIVGQFSYALITPRDQAPELPMSIGWAEVAQLVLVGFPENYPIQGQVNEALHRAGRRRPPEILCRYFTTQIAMVEAGSGAGVIPGFLLPTCANRRVAVHAIADAAPTGHLYWMSSLARPLPAEAETFKNFLEKFLDAQYHGFAQASPA